MAFPAPCVSPYGMISPNPPWDEVFIVGRGPSARKFDFSRLHGKTVLAVNDAIDFFPCATSLFSLDSTWIHRRRAFLQSFTGEIYLAIALDTFPGCGGIEGATYLQQSHDDGLSDDPRYVCTGCNSGYGAINVAYLKGARRIHLIGYDMNPRDSEHFPFWAPLFRNMLPQLKARGVEVLNHNPDSAIDAFPRSFGFGSPA